MTLVSVRCGQYPQYVQAGYDTGEGHHEDSEGNDKSSHTVAVRELLRDLSYCYWKHLKIKYHWFKELLIIPGNKIQIIILLNWK